MAETKPKAKTYKLDLFKETLPSIHMKIREFYEALDDDQKKEISPLILMRWLSLAEGKDAEQYIWLANNLLNVDFWSLTKYPELQWLLLTVAGTGSVPRKHTWVKGTKRESNSKINDVLVSLNPGLSDDEIEILKSKMDEDMLRNLLVGLAWQDANIKPLVEEMKNSRKNKNE